jgi:hypothetical protein
VSLWREKPATPNQQRIAFGKRKRKVSQADVIAQLLRNARARGSALELPDILETRIAQFQARLYELRKRGFVIENESERDGDRVRSRYWLRYDPDNDGGAR